MAINISTEHKSSLTGLSIAEMQAAFVPYKQPAYRAAQVYKWVHHHQVQSFDEKIGRASCRERV